MLPNSFIHRRTEALLAALAIVLSVGLTTTARADQVREYVDEVTAVSIMVPVDSLVFARERPDLAANARDYITLAPLEINRTGHRNSFWCGYIWSTIDRRNRERVIAADEHLVLLADGRPIPLHSPGGSLRDHGVGQPPTPVPSRSATQALFPTDPEKIAYVAAAGELRVVVVRNGVSEAFLLWKDAREGLREFVAKQRQEE